MANLSMTTVPALILALSIGITAQTARGRTAAIASALPSPAFMQYWKSGLAEISSYAITTERYGEMRKAQGVLVYVYEEIDSDTRIKVESDKTPPGKRVPVLKLNNVIKFSTGIYDYSIMTSVFAGLTPAGTPRPFPPQKISFSSQEWCGNVFQQILPRPQGLVSEIHSYFEAEGDAKVTLPYPKGPNGFPAAIYYEDEMPILLRELDGPILQAAVPIKINLVPGLWERRKRHTPLAFSQAVLTKVGSSKFVRNGKESATVKWTLETLGQTTTYQVEEAAPRHLVAWENSRGEKGEMIASLRSTYWEHNHTIDLPLRTKLGLTYGVDGN